MVSVPYSHTGDQVWILWRGGNIPYGACLVAQWVKNLPAFQETQETWVWSLGWEDPLEEEVATHSRTLAWRIPWTREPDRLELDRAKVTEHWSHVTACVLCYAFSERNYQRGSIYFMFIKYECMIILNFILYSLNWAPFHGFLDYVKLNIISNSYHCVNTQLKYFLDSYKWNS